MQKKKNYLFTASFVIIVTQEAYSLNQAHQEFSQHNHCNNHRILATVFRNRRISCGPIDESWSPNILAATPGPALKMKKK